MKKSLLTSRLVVLIMAMLVSGVSVRAEMPVEHHFTKTLTLGHYDLNISKKGIECALTYKRHEMSIGDLLVEYDQPILSGNLLGIDAANDIFDTIYKDVKDGFIYYKKLYTTDMLSPDSEEDSWAEIGSRTMLVNEIVTNEPKEIKTGLQYYDGRYMSILFLDEAPYLCQRRAFAMTVDLLKGRQVTLADLLASENTTAIKEHLCDVIRDNLSTAFEKYSWIREEMLADMEYYLSYFNLDTTPFFLAGDGEIYLFQAAYSVYLGESGVIPTGVYYHGDEPTIYSNSGDDGRDILISDVLDGKSFEEYVLQRKSWKYDPKLSYLLMGMARSSYSQQSIGLTLGTMGYKTASFGSYGDSSFDLAYGIGSKEIDGSLFVLIVLRGSATLGNWVRNFEAVPDTDGYHLGLKRSERDFYEELKSFLKTYLKNESIPTENVTYVITGHSAGAGVGNLLAEEMVAAGVPASSIYNYNFSCPDVACDEHGNWLGDGCFANIFNVADLRDPVSYLPGVGGWGKYGHSYWFIQDGSSARLDISSHFTENYLDYLAEYPNSNHFKIWEEVWAIMGKQIKEDLERSLKTFSGSMLVIPSHMTS